MWRFKCSSQGDRFKNPKSNRKMLDFLMKKEQNCKLLENGFIDSLTTFLCEVTGAYSWWSYRFNARKIMQEWRIDYFVVSED